MAEVFTAADYRPGYRPSDSYLTIRVALVVVAGPTVFAILIAIWRRLEHKFIAG